MFSQSQTPIWLIAKFKETVSDSRVDALFKAQGVGAMMKYLVNSDGSLTKVFLFSSGWPIEQVQDLIKTQITEAEWVQPSTGKNLIDMPGGSAVGQTSTGFLGMDTTTLLLIGGAAVAAFMLFRRKK
ncbi:MAG: hypothetical protein ABIG95_02460 [Candidatus Woesearchaeota archaeon]